MMVGPPGPSPNGQSVSNASISTSAAGQPQPGLSPFGQGQMSQAGLQTTTTAAAPVTTSQFSTSNGTAALPSSSPIHSQNQFDLMKVRLAQAVSYYYINIFLFVTMRIMS